MYASVGGAAHAVSCSLNMLFSRLYCRWWEGSSDSIFPGGVFSSGCWRSVIRQKYIARYHIFSFFPDNAYVFLSNYKKSRKQRSKDFLEFFISWKWAENHSEVTITAINMYKKKVHINQIAWTSMYVYHSFCASLCKRAFASWTLFSAFDLWIAFFSLWKWY